MCTLKAVNNNVIRATEEYLKSKQASKIHPDGEFDKISPEHRISDQQLNTVGGAK